MLDQNEKSAEDQKIEIEELQNRIKYLEDFLTSYRIEMEDEIQKTQKDMHSTRNHLSLLLSNMSYEIRIPMNGIIGMIDVLRQTPITPEQKEYIDVIENSSDSLLSTINDILDYSKIETGQIVLNYSVFNINTLIESVVRQLSPVARAKGLNLDFVHLIIPTEVSLLSDEERIKQILTYLINNSLKNSTNGHVLITVDVQKIRDKQVKLLIKLKDTGSSLSPELQKVIFKDAAVFTQVGEDFVSPGLGLSIAYDLVKLLKGDIGFHVNTDSVGTTYWFSIPVTVAEASEYDKPAEKQDVIRRSLNVLLVEDNFLNQKVVIATLEKAGHKVELAENGKIALELFYKNEYDLILMDIQMPIMDGIEATKNIRAFEKGHNRLPIKIMAVTAFALERDKEQCLNAGMDDFLAKPFKPSELLALIDKLKL
jgi:signal transduction histidine kinase/ActR/RegA family two-component response regulator